MDNSFGISTFLAALPAAIAALASIVVAIVSMCQTRNIYKNDQKRRDNEKNVEEAKQKLKTFYYPYLLIAKENTSLYKVFSQEHIAEDENYRTLTSLLSGKVFSENDSALLEQIIENDCRLRDLINKHADVVDDDSIRNKLVESATHYAIIELAFKKKISGEVERFKPYVHPNDVYDLVEEKAKKLEKEIEDAIVQ